MGKLLVVGVIVCGVALAVIGPIVYNVIKIQGYHKGPVKNFHPGNCKNIPGIEDGSEDMEILPGGKVLVTSGLKWPPGAPINPDTIGRILLVDLNQPDPKPKEVTIKGDLDLSNFNPLGITKWINKKIGKISILIINVIATTQVAVVERFVYSESENALYYVETLGLGDPNFYLVDDIVAVGERQFYFTNILTEHAHWEWKFLLPWQSVGYFDGSQSIIVDDGLPGPNGIAMSPDGKYIYVNMVFSGYVRTYERQSDNSLQQIQDYHLPFLPDNVMVSENGDVWETGPVVGWMAFEYMEDPKNTLNPTQAMRLTMKDGKVTSSSTVFLDDGTLHSAGTVSIKYKNKLIMGSVMTKATICEVSEES